MSKYTEAANRLHHLSMRYVGALHEVAIKAKVGMIAKDHPGNTEMRDLIDLILLTRAEINGLSRLLTDLKLVTPKHLEEIFTEQYEWLTKQKAHQLGIIVTDVGIELRPPNTGQN